jgi:hypothetical protein
MSALCQTAGYGGGAPPVKGLGADEPPCHSSLVPCPSGVSEVGDAGWGLAGAT